MSKIGKLQLPAKVEKLSEHGGKLYAKVEGDPDNVLYLIGNGVPERKVIIPKLFILSCTLPKQAKEISATVKQSPKVDRVNNVGRFWTWLVHPDSYDSLCSVCNFLNETDEVVYNTIKNKYDIDIDDI